MLDDVLKWFIILLVILITVMGAYFIITYFFPSSTLYFFIGVLIGSIALASTSSLEITDDDYERGYRKGYQDGQSDCPNRLEKNHEDSETT